MEKLGFKCDKTPTVAVPREILLGSPLSKRSQSTKDETWECKLTSPQPITLDVVSKSKFHENKTKTELKLLKVDFSKGEIKEERDAISQQFVINPADTLSVNMFDGDLISHDIIGAAKQQKWKQKTGVEFHKRKKIRVQLRHFQSGLDDPAKDPKTRVLLSFNRPEGLP